jgi:hypothetical protein
MAGTIAPLKFGRQPDEFRTTGYRGRLRSRATRVAIFYFEIGFLNSTF